MKTVPSCCCPFLTVFQYISFKNPNAIVNSHKEYMDVLLNNAIKAKMDDVQFLTATMDIKRIQADILPLITARSSDLISSNVLPVYKDIMGRETGEIELLHWESNPVTKALALKMQQDIALFVFRVLFIVEQCHNISQDKIKAKKNIKNIVDTEMADGTGAGPSIQSLVDKAVAARLKNLNLKASGSKTKVNNLSESYSVIFNFFSGQEKTESQSQKGQSHRPETQTPQSGKKSSKGHQWCEEQREWEGSSRAQEDWGNEAEEVVEVRPTSMTNFKYDVPVKTSSTKTWSEVKDTWIYWSVSK